MKVRVPKDTIGRTCSNIFVVNEDGQVLNAWPDFELDVGWAGYDRPAPWMQNSGFVSLRYCSSWEGQEHGRKRYHRDHEATTKA